MLTFKPLSTGFGSVAIRKGVGEVPTNFPEDAKGIKMRVPPVPIGIERFKNWGFTAVPMPFAELYTALQLGMSLRSLSAVTVWAVTMTGSIMAVLFFLFIMSRAMILEQVPRDTAEALLQVSENKYVLLLLINLLLLLIGMIVDDISGSVLAAIIFLPMVFLVTFVPELSLFLPRLLMGY
ncbi:TRAP transporter large permease subunit [Oceanospirillum beijerinckii]|uniref:TRAP transporter large permease subunit n=1 Tax=Oceanospirillum beijerinckii TaxID=64976 RepID=UPI0004830CE0|nr:TRAP transporter large permease subunit [Oceanospirillum beijerinckii]